MRECLNEVSKGKFSMNNVADPVDLLNFIFEILNERDKEDMKNNFYLKLHEFYSCNPKCNIERTTKYDNDNFIYQIYVEELFQYLDNNQKIKLNNYINGLFTFYQLSYLIDVMECTKCKKKMMKYISCENSPNILIINCVWLDEKPEIEKVIKFFFLIPLYEKFKRIFHFTNTDKKENINIKYYLTHIILYSSTLSHYIIASYNHLQKLFFIFDDSTVIEYKTYIELVEAITANLLRQNETTYFYPVLLMYSKSKIYEDDILNKNKLNENLYNDIIKKCSESIQEFRNNNMLTESKKKENYEKLMEKQLSLTNNNNNFNNNSTYNNIFMSNNKNNNLNNQMHLSQKGDFIPNNNMDNFSNKEEIKNNNGQLLSPQMQMPQPPPQTEILNNQKDGDKSNNQILNNENNDEIIFNQLKTDIFKNSKIINNNSLGPNDENNIINNQNLVQSSSFKSNLNNFNNNFFNNNNINNNMTQGINESKSIHQNNQQNEEINNFNIIEDI